MNIIKFNRTLKHSLVGIAIICMLGCKNELSRGEAEKQIKQKLQLPQDEYKEFNFKEKKAFVKWMEYDLNYDVGFGTHYKNAKEIEFNQSYPKSQFFSNLETENLITLKDEHDDSPPNGNYGYGRTEQSYSEFYVASFTDKAKPYLNGKSVKVSTIEFGEVTGIVEQKAINGAVVNYTVKRTNITPFGKVYSINEQTFNNTVIFTKYDDGWRIGN